MKKGLITSILALTFSGLQAQPLPASPKLVVTLTIDQLRTYERLSIFLIHDQLRNKKTDNEKK